MSQSDYIQQKRNITILNNSNNSLADVLTNKEYSEFKKYSIANTVENTLPTLNQLQTNNIRVFDSTYKRSCYKNVFCKTKGAYYERRKLSNILPTGYKNQIAMNDYFLTYKKKPNKMPCDSLYECDKYFFLKNQQENPLDETEDTFFYIG